MAASAPGDGHRTGDASADLLGFGGFYGANLGALGNLRARLHRLSCQRLADLAATRRPCADDASPVSPGRAHSGAAELPLALWLAHDDSGISGTGLRRIRPRLDLDDPGQSSRLFDWCSTRIHVVRVAVR